MRFILISLFLLCFVSVTTMSKEPDLLIVAAEHQMLQYQENGINKGTTIEILAEIMAASKLSGDVEYMPWARAFTIAKSQPNTLVLSMIRTPQREKYFHWLLKVSESARVFISLASKPENKVLNAIAAKTKTIAVVRGSLAHNELLAKGFSEEKNIYLVASRNKMFSLFFKGRVDLVYTDPNAAQAYLSYHYGTNELIDYAKITPSQRRESYIATNKKISPQLLTRLEVAIKHFSLTDKYRYLLEKE